MQINENKHVINIRAPSLVHVVWWRWNECDVNTRSDEMHTSHTRLARPDYSRENTLLWSKDDELAVRVAKHLRHVGRISMAHDRK